MRGAPDLGDYEVLLPLAMGGMASVDLARHRAAGGVERLVVIKRIHPHLSGIREHIEMFLDEARLASQIHHPHVVAVDDVVDANGELFLVQPFIPSVPLSALIEAAAARGERIAPPIASRILCDALSGLDGAHHTRDLRGEPLGIVHRDVSPHNLLVGTDGRSRVIDFGIATALRRITVTRGDAIKGKVHYMAPEHLRRQPLDARADVFSAAVVLYETLTGARPFEGDDEADTLLSILIGEPAPPSTKAEGLGEALDDVVACGLAVDRDERFTGAAAMLDALEKAAPPAAPRDVADLVERLCGERVAALQSAVRASLDAGAKADLAPPSEAEAPSALRPRSRRSWLPLAGFALLAATALAIGALTAETAEESKAPEATSASAPAAATTKAASAEAPSATSAPSPAPPSSTQAFPSARARAAPAPSPEKTAAPTSEPSALHPNPYLDPG